MLRKNVLAAFVVALFAGGTFAGPLLPSEPLVTDVAGESIMAGIGSSSGTNYARVDWMVLDGGDYSATIFNDLVLAAYGTSIIPAGQYLYAYQIETLSTAGGDTFTVQFSTGATVSVLTAGFVGTTTAAAADLDDVGHTSATFANLGGSPSETDAAIMSGSNFDTFAVVSTGVVVDVPNNNITWNYAAIPATRETTTMWFTADVAPHYTFGRYTDSFSSEGLVPTPIPAPAALPAGLALLGGMFLINRRRRRAAV